MTPDSGSRYATVLNVAVVLALLFLFLVGIKGLGTGFNLLGKDVLDAFFTAVTIEEARKNNAPRVGRGQQENVGRIYPRQRRRSSEEQDRLLAEKMERDEAEAAGLLAGAHRVVRGSFVTQVQTHCCLESHGVVCTWSGDKKQMVLDTP